MKTIQELESEIKALRRELARLEEAKRLIEWGGRVL